MRILVIEDDKEILKFLKRGLESECFAVDIAEDGEKGSFMARTNDYDVIILDFMLPKKDGLEVCRDIRDHGKDTPILVLSVVMDTKTKVDILNAGADDYITKPYSFEELTARVNALLRRPKQIEKNILRINNLTLDKNQHLVKRGSHEIRLTRKEFMLLEYLMKNPSIVLSREMIMEHVWDINADPFSNTVETHILSLRKKINLKSQRNLICTIRGRGYKIGE